MIYQSHPNSPKTPQSMEKYAKYIYIYHRHSNKYLDVERTHRARSTTSTQDLLSTALLSPDIETVVLLE